MRPTSVAGAVVVAAVVAGLAGTGTLVALDALLNQYAVFARVLAIFGAIVRLNPTQNEQLPLS